MCSFNETKGMPLEVTWTHGDERDHFRLCRDAEWFWPCDGRPEHTWGWWGTLHLHVYVNAHFSFVCLLSLRFKTFFLFWFFFFFLIIYFFRNIIHENHEIVIIIFFFLLSFTRSILQHFTGCFDVKDIKYKESRLTNEWIRQCNPFKDQRGQSLFFGIWGGYHVTSTIDLFFYVV